MVMIGSKQITFSLYLCCPWVGPHYPLSYATHKSPPMRSPRGSSPQPTTSLSLTFSFLLSHTLCPVVTLHLFLSLLIIITPPARPFTMLQINDLASKNHHILFLFLCFPILSFLREGLSNHDSCHWGNTTLLLWLSTQVKKVKKQWGGTSAIGIHVERRWSKRGRKNLFPTHTHMNQHASALHVPQHLTSLHSF